MATDSWERLPEVTAVAIVGAIVHTYLVTEPLSLSPALLSECGLIYLGIEMLWWKSQSTGVAGTYRVTGPRSDWMGCVQFIFF